MFSIPNYPILLLDKDDKNDNNCNGGHFCNGGRFSLAHVFCKRETSPIAETPPSLLSKKTLPMLEEIEQAESCRHRDSEHIDGSYQEAEDAETKKNLAVRHQL